MDEEYEPIEKCVEKLLNLKDYFTLFELAKRTGGNATESWYYLHNECREGRLKIIRIEENVNRKKKYRDIYVTAETLRNTEKMQDLLKEFGMDSFTRDLTISKARAGEKKNEIIHRRSERRMATKKDISLKSEIVTFLKKNKGATRREVEDHLGIDSEKTRQLFNSLMKQSFIAYNEETKQYINLRDKF